jgi:NADH:ubiquinone oxidoreductase subunit F (NADH-binding)
MLRRRARKMLGTAVEMVLESELNIVTRIQKIEPFMDKGRMRFKICFRDDGMDLEDLKKLEQICQIIDFRTLPKGRP